MFNLKDTVECEHVAENRHHDENSRYDYTNVVVGVPVHFVIDQLKRFSVKHEGSYVSVVPNRREKTEIVDESRCQSPEKGKGQSDTGLSQRLGASGAGDEPHDCENQRDRDAQINGKRSLRLDSVRILDVVGNDAGGDFED